MDLEAKMLGYYGLLYKIAYTKTEDMHETEDLVQETFFYTLKALNQGRQIENIKSYLLKVLDNKYNDLLRQKYNKHSLVSNKSDESMVNEDNEEFTISDEDQNKSIVSTAIRRELAYLTKIYREVMVQYYMEKKSVNEIANDLDISRSSVLSRLDRGRKKIKEGVIKMEAYLENSYRPDELLITNAGRLGLNNEPLSVLSSKIEENILVLAYKKPISIKEISEKIGVPTVFIEEAVDKLINQEFMRYTGNLVYTNFLIIDDDMIRSKKDVQNVFVSDTFDELKGIFNELVCEYIKLGVLDSYNKTQLFLYALLSISTYIHYHLMNEFKLLKEADFPERPNNGKWLIAFGYRNNTKKKEWAPSYRLAWDFISTHNDKLHIEVWDTILSKTPWHENSRISQVDIGQLLYSLHKQYEFYESRKQFIPDLLRLGFLTIDESGGYKACIPTVKESDFNLIKQLNENYARKCLDVIGDRLIEMVKNNIIDLPKLITPISPRTHLMCIDGLAITYVLKASEEGLIVLDKDKNYPICLMIEK